MNEIPSVFDRSIEVTNSILDYLLEGSPNYALEYDGSFSQAWVMLLNSLVLVQTELPYNTRILVFSKYNIPVSQELFPFSNVVFENYNEYTYTPEDWDRVIVVSDEVVPRYNALNIYYREHKALD